MVSRSSQPYSFSGDHLLVGPSRDFMLFVTQVFSQFAELFARAGLGHGHNLAASRIAVYLKIERWLVSTTSLLPGELAANVFHLVEPIDRAGQKVCRRLVAA